MADASEAAHGAKRNWPRFVLLAACGAAAATASEPVHTVAGSVVLSPACGGAQREGQDCRSVYAAVEVRLIDRQGRVQASARTDDQGHFELAGPRGAYTLLVMSPKVVRCAAPSLSLPLGSGVPLTLSCDSGMR